MKKYFISILLITLLVTTGVYKVQSQIKIQNENINNNNINTNINNQNVNENKNVNDKPKEVKPEPIIMQATAYDLSIQCCGKSYSNPSRGKTTDGYNLTNKHHSETWVVSSNKFPMGTKLQLEFPESHKQYNGIYICRDTGNFDENVLDIYLGDFGEKVSKETINFGRVDVRVEIIK